MEVVEPPEFVVEMELYFSSPPPPPAYDGLTEKFVTTTTAARVDRMVLLKVELNILISVSFSHFGLFRCVTVICRLGD